MMKINERIRLLRLTKNYTQIYMAEELGIDAANYSRLENGQSKLTVDRLEKICEILEINIDLLLSSDLGIKKINNSNENEEILREILEEVKQIKQKLK